MELEFERNPAMRERFMSFVTVMFILLGSSRVASAQTKQPSQAPSTASSSSNSFDPHDLSGVWMQDRPRMGRVIERYWIYELTLEEPPMTAWGEAQYKAAKSSFGTRSFPIAETNDPIYHSCSPTGFPRAFFHAFPIQIVQLPAEVVVLFEWDSLRHQIFTDGRKHDESLGPLWMGDSIGHWEGNTLVTDTVNFNDKTWLDRIGHPHSGALHVIEHIRRVDHDHLEDEITIDDPKAYTKPWTGKIVFALKPKWTLAEEFCEDIGSFENIELRETTPAK
jgi:hypothetical protein